MIIGTMREEHIIKILIIFLFFLIGCGDIPKEGDGSEKVQVEMKLNYDNRTKRQIDIYIL